MTSIGPLIRGLIAARAALRAPRPSCPQAPRPRPWRSGTSACGLAGSAARAPVRRIGAVGHLVEDRLRIRPQPGDRPQHAAEEQSESRHSTWIALACGCFLSSAIFSGRICTSQKTTMPVIGTMISATQAMTSATVSSAGREQRSLATPERRRRPRRLPGSKTIESWGRREGFSWFGIRLWRHHAGGLSLSGVQRHGYTSRPCMIGLRSRSYTLVQARSGSPQASIVAFLIT